MVRARGGEYQREIEDEDRLPIAPDHGRGGARARGGPRRRRSDEDVEMPGGAPGPAEGADRGRGHAAPRRGRSATPVVGAIERCSKCSTAAALRISELCGLSLGDIDLASCDDARVRQGLEGAHRADRSHGGAAHSTEWLRAAGTPHSNPSAGVGAATRCRIPQPAWRTVDAGRARGV